MYVSSRCQVGNMVERSGRDRRRQTKWQSIRHRRRLAWLDGTIMHSCYGRLPRAMHAFHFYIHILDYSRPLVVDGSRSLGSGEDDWSISIGKRGCTRAYGAQQSGRGQAWMQPKRSARRYLLQSLRLSITPVHVIATYKDQDRRKHYQRRTCLLGT